MRIAILTFHRAYNCGAMLQAWALKTVLERMGHHVEFPDLNEVGYERSYWLVQNIPAGRRGLSWIRAFVGRLLLDLTRGRKVGPASARAYERFRRRLHCKSIGLEELQDRYDLVVVGSDQVFNPVIAGNWTELFLCEKMPLALKRISYAASCGDRPLEMVDRERLKNALKNFSEVSFRERFGDYKVVLDPTLLLSEGDYSSIGLKQPRLCPDEYVFMYTIFGTEYELSVARMVAKSKRLPLVVMSAHSRPLAAGELAIRQDPDKLVALVRHAKYVLAGSFHGTALAVIFRKKFISIREDPNEEWSRPSEFLSQIGMLDRLVNPSRREDAVLNALEAEFDPAAASRLDRLRCDSLEWLSNAVKKAV